MPQKTLRFKIHQDGRVEETVVGFTGNSCNEATKNLEEALGKVTVKNKTSDAFISNQNENLKQTRDYLLPKLISGKVDVSDLDIDTGILDD